MTSSSSKQHGVRPSDADFTLPSRTLEELFPGISPTEVRVISSQIYRLDEWSLPLTELLTLAAVCKHARPRRIFEIGTYTGSSTLAMAMNTPCDTDIITLDLDPSERQTHKHGLGVGGFPPFTVGSCYEGTLFRPRIHQLFANSVAFDYSSYHSSIDLVFIDADHTYEFVKADTENGFKLLRTGGIIIWDDYLWDERYPECKGVTRLLHELRDSTACFQISGTRFAIYLDGQ